MSLAFFADKNLIRVIRLPREIFIPWNPEAIPLGRHGRLFHWGEFGEAKPVPKNHQRLTGESRLGKGPEEGDEFFSLSGRDVHKTQTNIELMFPLALELIVPEHLGFDGPRVAFP